MQVRSVALTGPAPRADDDPGSARPVRAAESGPRSAPGGSISATSDQPAPGRRGPAILFSVTANNVLYYGDNLDVLRRHVPDESVDLV